MKIVVLGATGTTGRLVVDEALAAGHEVVAFVRRPEAVAAALKEVKRKEKEKEKQVAAGNVRRMWNPDAFAARGVENL